MRRIATDIVLNLTNSALVQYPTETHFCDRTVSVCYMIPNGILTPFERNIVEVGLRIVRGAP